MPLWKNTDAAANSTIFAAAQLKQTPNTNNRDALFGNTTSNAYFDNVTVGQYAVDDKEIAAGGGAVAHTGWVLRTSGTGGRAGRVMTEVLVAGGITTDGADDAIYPDYTIRITTQPMNRTVNASSTTANTTTLSVVAASTPNGATLAYLWQANTGSGFVNAASGTTGNTTATLTVSANSFANGTQFRVVVQATGAANVTSNAAVLTVTA